MSYTSLLVPWPHRASDPGRPRASERGAPAATRRRPMGRRTTPPWRGAVPTLRRTSAFPPSWYVECTVTASDLSQQQRAGERQPMTKAVQAAPQWRRSSSRSRYCEHEDADCASRPERGRRNPFGIVAAQGERPGPARRAFAFPPSLYLECTVAASDSLSHRQLPGPAVG